VNDYLPLKGVKVLDLSHTLAGPFATLIMADLGAEVIKVEPPEGDESREFSPIVNGVSSYYLSINRGKKSVVLNLKDENDKKILYNLAKESNIVIENYRPGVREKLGVDPQTLFKLNSNLVYLSVKGFRSNSIYNDKPAYDMIIQAMSGLMLTTGRENDPPVRIPFALFDIITGEMAAIYALSGLYSNAKPYYAEVYLFDSALFAMSYIPMMYLIANQKPKRLGSAHPSMAPHQAFMGSDKKWFVVAVGNDRHWNKLCEVLNLNQLKDDPRFKTNNDRVRNKEELSNLLQQIFSNKRRDEWIEILEKSGVPVAPVYDIEEVFKDPYANLLVFEMSHEILGKIKQIKEPGIINNKEPISFIPPPLLGENTDEVKKKFINKA